ncbi:FxsB family cyclophane-forming radical SAM/SPASM peptide maturase [Streptomyces sp. NBC_01198]|uniref:FxsB family cyclophane-forming radical SAM/SPASM peptide maturase n=1 Tax=Streptomyces sp. NBC_01198 TaxID=2903769 RepID=UPI002E0FD769|nr:FxsB family radical SAM/SPASM domain protein [Streptomyces sp. NBC_01198]
MAQQRRRTVPRTESDSVIAAPIRQFILKTHSRCNLACTYCYLYAGQDEGWRDRPRAVSPEIAAHTAHRIAEHVSAHRLPEIAVVLHGGEPLLAGADRLAADVERLRRTVPATVHASVQTNGTLLTADGIERLRDARIRVGVSLDGGRAGHNAARVDHAGRPGWPAAAAGLRLLAATAPEAYAGVLCVVDLRQDPVDVYDSLLAFAPPAIDLLLPHGNWTVPPPGLPAPPGDPAPYGRWLTAVFDRWWAADRRETRVRLFEECVALLLGVPAATERLGLQPFTAVVVETDGSIEQVDSLKSAYEGAAATGLDVFRHSFDQVLAHPGVAARQAGLAALGAECRACPLVTVCGGGHYAHRYLAGSGFRNRSVYCADLAHLIRHIGARLAAAAGAGVPAAAETVR